MYVIKFKGYILKWFEDSLIGYSLWVVIPTQWHTLKISGGIIYNGNRFGSSA